MHTYLDMVIHSGVSGQFLRLLCHLRNGLTELFESCLPRGCRREKRSHDVTSKTGPPLASHDPTPSTESGPLKFYLRRESVAVRRRCVTLEVCGFLRKCSAAVTAKSAANSFSKNNMSETTTEPVFTMFLKFLVVKVLPRNVGRI